LMGVEQGWIEPAAAGAEVGNVTGGAVEQR
jgi:hypothetical protein